MTRRSRPAPRIFKHATKAELTQCLKRWCAYCNRKDKSFRIVCPKTRLVGMGHDGRFWMDTKSWRNR